MMGIFTIIILTAFCILVALGMFTYIQDLFMTNVHHTIKKGKHYSKPILPFFFGWNDTRLTTRVTFKKNCIYNESELPYTGVNKLTGITYGLVHKDSYRWGWRCRDGKFILYAYIYDDGERYYKEVATVYPEEENELMILRWITKVQYFVNGKMVYEDTEIDFNGDFPLTYINRPYFGGKSVAPHDMDIKIKYSKF